MTRFRRVSLASPTDEGLKAAIAQFLYQIQATIDEENAIRATQKGLRTTLACLSALVPNSTLTKPRLTNNPTQIEQDINIIAQHMQRLVREQAKLNDRIPDPVKQQLTTLPAFTSASETLHTSNEIIKPYQAAMAARTALRLEIMTYVTTILKNPALHPSQNLPPKPVTDATLDDITTDQFQALQAARERLAQDLV